MQATGLSVPPPDGHSHRQGDDHKERAVVMVRPILLSRHQAAKALGVSLSLLDDLVADGSLVSVQLRGRRMFRPRDLAAFADAMPIAPTDRLKKKRENAELDS